MTQTPEADRAAFEALYTEHYWALLRFAVRRSPDHDSARDLVADTFAVAWRHRHRIPPDRALPWLYRVAGNLLANRRRRSARADEVTRRLGKVDYLPWGKWCRQPRYTVAPTADQQAAVVSFDESGQSILLRPGDFSADETLVIVHSSTEPPGVKVYGVLQLVAKGPVAPCDPVDRPAR